MKKAYLNENGSSETIITAIFLITAIIAAGFVINAVLPIVSTMSGTFQSSTNAADEKMRTDFKIVATFANQTPGVGGYDIYMKNTGSERIHISVIDQSEVFCGQKGHFGRLTNTTPNTDPVPGYWKASIIPNTDDYWNPGETLWIIATPPIPAQANPVFFQFILPNGIWRSIEFSV